MTASIVLYKNDIVVLESAISSFLNSDSTSLLYLVDHSPTDSLRILQNIDHRIIYIFNPKNPGFGAGHNIALKKGIEKNSKFHLVLNPDAYFDQNVLKALIDYLVERPEIGNIMPKVLYPNGKLQYLCKLLPTPYDWIGRRFNPFNSLVEKRNNLFELRFTKYNKVMDVPYLSGCFMLLKTEALLEIGLFDENIFMYGEETDLCRRLISGGYRTVYYPNVNIYHHFEKGSHKSWRLTRIGMQSAIYYFNKWGWFFDKERRKINAKTLKTLGK